MPRVDHGGAPVCRMPSSSSSLPWKDFGRFRVEAEKATVASSESGSVHLKAVAKLTRISAPGALRLRGATRTI